MDVLGPLPQTESGNRFILVVSDYFTKWTEAYALPDHTAETVATHLIGNFISRFGIPETIHSDQGRDFQSRLFQQMCRILEIEQTRTSPWRPQSDGQVERFNRTLGAMMRQVVEHQAEWDRYLPLLTMAYRSSRHATTGHSPNFLMLGRELPMPTHLIAKPPSQSDNVCQYVKELQRKLEEAHQVAQVHGAGEHRRQKRLYDAGATRRKIEVKDKVWLFNPTRKAGVNPKLHIYWEKDPYTVEKVISDHILLIAKTGPEGIKKTRVIHKDYVRPMVQRPEEWQTKTLPKDVQAEASPLEEIGIIPRRSRRLQHLPPL